MLLIFVVRWSPIRACNSNNTTVTWEMTHTHMHTIWKPQRNTQQDWSPSAVLIGWPPAQTRRYQLGRAVWFLRHPPPARKMEIMMLWAPSLREILMAAKGQEVLRDTSEKGRSEPFLTSALVLLKRVCWSVFLCNLPHTALDVSQ